MITKTILTLGIMAGFVIGISFSSAYAGIPWSTTEIADDAITSKKINDREIKSRDIKGNSIKSGKIRDGTITTADLAPGTKDFNVLTNVPDGLDNGDQDGLRTYNKNLPYGAPCNALNSDTSTVSYLIRDNAAITQLGFDPFIGSLPIFAEAGEPFIGEVIQFAGNFAPRGWAFAEGQILSISQNTALFSLLGTNYGGDGRTTFALPDLRCMEPDVSGNQMRYIIALVGVYPSRN